MEESQVPSYVRTLISEGTYHDAASVALELQLAQIDTLQEVANVLVRINESLDSIAGPGVQVSNQNDNEIIAALRYIGGEIR